MNAGTQTQSPVVRYVNAGRDLSCEATSLREKQYLQDQLDVFNILRGFDSLMDDFDIHSKSRTEEQPTQPKMNRRMKSMAKMYDLGTSFWHLCLTDIPWQLGEGTRTSLLDADLGINPASTIVQDQFLSRHPSYENAVLVRSLFQCYQRTGQNILFNPHGMHAYHLQASCLQCLRSLVSITSIKTTCRKSNHGRVQEQRTTARLSSDFLCRSTVNPELPSGRSSPRSGS